MALDGGYSARPIAEPDSRRPLWPTAVGPRRSAAAGTGLRPTRFPSALPWSDCPAQHLLHLYAGHLVRARDGSWSVFADYTQGPPGAGLALENRIATSRILPADFHNLHVERLAGFFITLRDTLQSLSAERSDNPRVVLLSPGPRSPSYFEDAYLARYLGYTLVEGGDLTVRGTNVYLKTLGGLLPVDVISAACTTRNVDPLELRSESMHGVAGLVQAARSGQVVVANALGSGLSESSALMAFLPAICRSLLGEDLKLPSVPTWWCGRDDDWSYVEAHFGELVLRPAVPSRSQGPIDMAVLDDRAARALLGDRPSTPSVVHGAGPLRALNGAGVRQRRSRGMAHRTAVVCRSGTRRRLSGHARRPGPSHAACAGRGDSQPPWLGSRP